jgi:hypothetical protein
VDIEVSDQDIRTHGDNNSSDDPCLVSSEEFLGQVVAAIEGQVDLSPGLTGPDASVGASREASQ